MNTIKLITLTLFVTIFSSCGTRTANSSANAQSVSHSCPREGHGPCYLGCNEVKKPSKFNEWDFMFAFTGI